MPRAATRPWKALATLAGNVHVLQQVMASFGDFEQYFEIMPGTKSVVPAPST
jgi:hypothetical protein